MKLGTESHGDVRHIVFSNCVIRNSRTGIALLAKDGGVMEDIRFSNIVMTTQPKWGQGVEWPIVVDVEKRTEQSRLSRIRDVSFSDITVYTKGRIMASGMPDNRIELLSFRNILMRVTGYEKIDGVHKMRGGAKTAAEGMPDYGPVPAAAILAHIKGVSIEGFSTVWDTSGATPERHMIFGDRLEDAYFSGLTGGALGKLEAVKVVNSKGVVLK